MHTHTITAEETLREIERDIQQFIDAKTQQELKINWATLSLRDNLKLVLEGWNGHHNYYEDSLEEAGNELEEAHKEVEEQEARIEDLEKVIAELEAELQAVAKA